MKFAIIENGIVVNIAEGTHALTAKWVPISAGCPVAIGDTYAGGIFYDEEGVERLTPEQRKAAERIAELEEEKKLLSAQIQALSDRGDFLEDCIAEMAGIIYA